MGRPRKKMFTPNDPHALRICKELAKEIGFNEAIVLLQLEFLIGISTHNIDGREWTYQSLRTLQKEHFPWWSTATIQRALKSLEGKGLIIVANYNKKKYDKTRWFALNLEECDNLASLKVDWATVAEPKALRIDTGVVQNETGVVQNDTTIPETTPETTTEEIPAQAQIETPVKPIPAAVPSESDKDDAFKEELLEDSRRLNAQPPKHISTEQRIADTRAASARGWARQTYLVPPELERALKRYGDEAPALRGLQELINTEFGLVPDWSNKRQVKSWASGLKEVWVASREDQGVIVAAGKYLRENGLPIASPRSLTKMARSIAAERATAYVAPSARAVKEYV